MRYPVMRGNSIVPEIVAQALGKGLLLLDQSGGGLMVEEVGVEAGGRGEVFGILHRLLQRLFVELDDFIADAGGRNDGAGSAEPLVIVAELAQRGDVGLYPQAP